jgi:hypothetical protein
MAAFSYMQVLTAFVHPTCNNRRLQRLMRLLRTVCSKATACHDILDVNKSAMPALVHCSSLIRQANRLPAIWLYFCHRLD